jgi:helicase
MEVGYLNRFGIPERVIPCWRESGYGDLLPLQVKAIEEGELLGEENLIISAPASSGKTFCAEIAAIGAIAKLKKVVFLVPLKAVAEEKYHDFLGKYEPLGLEVVISTADRAEFDERITNGQFDLAIVIYEKFNRFLVKNLYLLKTLDLVIVDELQMLREEKRGEVLSVLLTKVMQGQNPPRLLCLAPLEGDWGKVASLLGAHLLHERNRPVELRRGVLESGEFRYRRFNDLSEATESVCTQDEIGEEVVYPHLNGFFAAVYRFVSSGEQVLVFLKSKSDTIRCAQALAERLRLSPAQDSLSGLKDLEETTLSYRLAECLEHGCAFHNADLNLEQRFLVETGFRSGDIRLLCSTTTLAMGVNLPAKNVFLETQKYLYSPDSDRSVLIPIGKGEFENMSGRAGRFGEEKEFGRSLVIAPNRLQSELLWDKYIRGGNGDPPSAKRTIALPEIILDLVVSGSATDFSSLQGSLVKVCRLHEAKDASTAEIENGLSKVLELRLLEATGSGFRRTKLGEAFSSSGIRLGTGGEILNLLPGGEGLTLADWVFRLCGTPDGEEVYLPLREIERKRRYFRDALGEEVSSPELAGLINGETVGSTREVRHLKAALILSDWVKEIPTIEIEKRYQVLSGTIRRIAERMSWLLRAVVSLGEAESLQEGFLKRVEEFSSSLLFGITPPGFELGRLHLPGLSRDFLWRLKGAGIVDLASVAGADHAVLRQLLPERLALSLKETARNAGQRGRATKVSPSWFGGGVGPHRRRSGRHCLLETSRKIEPKPESIGRLRIEGRAVKNRFLVEVDGRKLLLTHKLHEYLLKLIRALRKKEGGWINKFDLEGGDNQSRYLWRLKRALEPYFPKGSVIIDNNRMGGYRLNIKLKDILISEELLT